LESRIKLVSNRRANGPLMQLNVNFNGPRWVEQCPWIVATDAQCDGYVRLLPKKCRSGPEAIPEGPVVLDVTEAACAMDASGAFTAAPISAATRLYRSGRRAPAVRQAARVKLSRTRCPRWLAEKVPVLPFSTRQSVS